MMVNKNLSLILIISATILLFSVYLCVGCKEAICASVVSRCMLMQSCKCDMKNNCSCCRDCFMCLAEFYEDCCSCVDMCPKPNDSDTRPSQKSHVEDLPEPFPNLFQVLTEEKDHQLRWIAFSFPAHQDIAFYKPNMFRHIEFAEASAVNREDAFLDDPSLNCTVAYMSQCMSWNKCKNSCRSMGASSYRWFHDGCCECVGNMCLNYGISESRCLKCPPDKDIDTEIQDDNKSEDDYGQEVKEEKSSEKKEEYEMMK